MQSSATHDQKIARMTFSSVYPHYLAKVEKKGRSKQELHEVLRWLTGYAEKEIAHHLDANSTFEAFFASARLHPNASLVTGTICGHRIEELAHPLTRSVRILDKLVDELARGRPMDKVLRTA